MYQYKEEELDSLMREFGIEEAKINANADTKRIIDGEECAQKQIGIAKI